MMSTPLISIVLPTYNGAPYLAEAVESCIHQTYENWELIIVDDGSTDDTPSLIAEYAAKDRRIRSIRHTENRKLPATLNTGFREAHGEFHTWTSDDNRYRTEALAVMSSFLKAHPSTDIVYCQFSIVDQQGRFVSSGRIGPVTELPLRSNIGPCFLYRRVVHEQLGGYDEELFLVEDYDFWLRASTLFQLTMLPNDLYIYRRHDRSLTMMHREAIRLAVERCLEKNLPRLAWLDRDLRDRAYQRLVRMALDRQAPDVAVRYFRQWQRCQAVRDVADLAR